MKEDLEIIHKEAKRSVAIAKGLLNYARKDHETHHLAINYVIEEVLQLRAYEHKQNNITVKTALFEGLPEIPGNAARLQQVFINLIVNAEQAMLEARKGSTLTIMTKLEGNVISASVGDDGPGIKREDMKYLFTPFFTTKPKGKGTGLGLSICQSIIKEHNGAMRVESEEGRGTNFIIEIPVTSHVQQ